MVSPICWRGYDQENNEIAICQSENMSSRVNINALKQKIQQIEDQLPADMKEITAKLREIGTGSKKEKAVMKETKTKPTIDALADDLDSANIASSIIDNIKPIIQQAEETIDKLQEMANDNAYNQVKNTHGVVSVRS